ncbi:Probable UDP-arabinopyranose mutase 5, variant 2 [Ancistrocladus abbreviatus]
MPPTVLSLAIDSALLNISHFSDLSALPDHILLDLFLLNCGIKIGFYAVVVSLILASGRTLRAGKLTKKNLKLFVAAGKEEVLSFIQELNIQHVRTPVLPTSYSCRYFGYLVSRRKYILSVDDDCRPAKDENGFLIDALDQHITNLATPATPLFFNTLYDPFRKGADFVRGYPFSMRNGVPCALSCGLWLNLADVDAPTQALKPEQRNSRYVDAVITIPTRVMMPLSGINIGFNRELLGPVLFPGLKLSEEGKFRWETVEDIWCGMCAKVMCDHLGYGVKSGLPYVWRNERGDAIATLKKEWEGMKLMEEAVPFFQSVKLSAAPVTAEDCLTELAALVKEKLGPVNPLFSQAADAMTEWVKLWKKVGSGSS